MSRARKKQWMAARPAFRNRSHGSGGSTATICVPLKTEGQVQLCAVLLGIRTAPLLHIRILLYSYAPQDPAMLDMIDQVQLCLKPLEAGGSTRQE